MALTRYVIVRRAVPPGLGTPPWLPALAPPASALPSRTEVLVVGAGITGLSAAMALAADGCRVTVVEHQFGEGATSRSGGVVLGETLVGADRAFDDCDLALRSWIEHQHIDCDAAWPGCLELARDPERPATPDRSYDSGPLRLIARVRGGVVNPARLLGALAAAALTAGIDIVTGVNVTALCASSDTVTAVTSGGEIRAKLAVMATDATTGPPTPDPWILRGFTIAMQTTPLEQDTVKAIGLAPNDAFYSDDAPLLWGRVLPDGSLLIGREFLDLAPTPDVPNLAREIERGGERLLARARGLHRELAHVGFARVWGGAIARTASGRPGLESSDALPNVIWAGGYGGHGIAQAFRVGELIADRVTAVLA